MDWGTESCGMHLLCRTATRNLVDLITVTFSRAHCIGAMAGSETLITMWGIGETMYVLETTPVYPKFQIPKRVVPNSKTGGSGGVVCGRALGRLVHYLTPRQTWSASDLIRA